jgi:hypothetical protein
MNPDMRIGLGKGLETVLQIGEIAECEMGNEQDLVRFFQQVGWNQLRGHK